MERPGRQFRDFLRACHAGRPVSVRQRRGDRRERAHPAARADQHELARLRAGRAARPALRISSPWPVGSGAAAIASIQTRSSWIPTRRPWRVRSRGTMRCSGTRSSTRTPTSRSIAATTPRSRRSRPSSIRPSRGATTARPRTPWHETVIYEMHVRGFSMLQTRLPGAHPRHLRSAHDRHRDQPPAEARA